KIIKFQWKIGLKVNLSLKEIAKEVNPIILGWINYYGAFYRSRLKSLGFYIDRQIMKWFRNKYKGLKWNIGASSDWLRSVYTMCPKLFAHWSFFPVY
ncbi:MAG TPA: group II intron maturase-specific domain-containing protein, partial [Oligoflexus sp.]|uniref:group II intron maturase-specific domain-containing protein n=1 Tax=Oligoflexus sp. TaxID=1971216 RepID=UPI002D5C3272